MEDLRKYYQEKRLHQKNLGNIEESQMLQYTIDFLKFCKQSKDFFVKYTLQNC